MESSKLSERIRTKRKGLLLPKFHYLQRCSQKEIRVWARFFAAGLANSAEEVLLAHNLLIARLLQHNIDRPRIKATFRYVVVE